jgi:hypothetical protein
MYMYIIRLVRNFSTGHFKVVRDFTPGVSKKSL